MIGLNKLFLNVLLYSTLMIMGCSEDNYPFRAEGRISGLVTFRNPLAESAVDSAKGVSIKVLNSAVGWTSVAPKGYYDYPFLSEGAYNISFSYVEGSITYGYDTLFNLDKNQYIEISPTLLPTDGHLQLSGSVTYVDILSSSTDETAAVGALVELLDEEGNIIKNTSVNGEGNYLFDSLKSGDYLLRTTLVDSTSSEFVYIQEDYINLKASDQTNQLLTWNNEGALLIIEILDGNDFPISNAQVCIYQNEALFEASPAACLGSLISLETNSAGKVVFTDLEDRRYWIEGVFLFGDLSSIANDIQITAVPQGAITTATIKLN